MISQQTLLLCCGSPFYCLSCCGSPLVLPVMLWLSLLLPVTGQPPEADARPVLEDTECSAQPTGESGAGN
jgi:hypothetical protein